MKLAITVPAVLPNASLESGIAIAADMGVNSVEFFDWEDKNLDAILAAGNDNNIEFACTLAAGGGSNIDDLDEPAMTNPADASTIIEDIERSIPIASELDSHLIVTVGPEQENLDRTTQFESIVDVLSEVASAAEEADVTIAIEPLNIRVDHPSYFLTTADEGFKVIEAVDSPNVKLLYDVYHQQITEGNIIQTLTENLDLIGHVHIADVPGRHEPGTGELNYPNILQALEDADYEGYVGCEFFPSDDPYSAVKDIKNMIR